MTPEQRAFSSPHGDFSFSISASETMKRTRCKSFRPLTGISLFLSEAIMGNNVEEIVFVPSRGFLFFYVYSNSSFTFWKDGVFVPSRGFLFFYYKIVVDNAKISVFVPSRGFLFFYTMTLRFMQKQQQFSSPHGDFSFSMFQFPVH